MWPFRRKKAPLPIPPPPPNPLDKVDLEAVARRHRRRHLARKYSLIWLNHAGLWSSVGTQRGATPYRIGVEFHKGKTYASLPLGVSGGTPSRIAPSTDDDVQVKRQDEFEHIRMLLTFHRLLRLSKVRKAEREAMRKGRDHDVRNVVGSAFEGMFQNKVEQQKRRIQKELNDKVAERFRYESQVGLLFKRLRKNTASSSLETILNSKADAFFWSCSKKRAIKAFKVKYAERRMDAMCELAAEAFWRVNAVGRCFEGLKEAREGRVRMDKAGIFRGRRMMKIGLGRIRENMERRGGGRRRGEAFGVRADKGRMKLALLRINRNVSDIKQQRATENVLNSVAETHWTRAALSKFVRRVAQARGRRISAAVESVRWRVKGRVVRTTFGGWREWAEVEGRVGRFRKYWGKRRAIGRWRERTREGKRERRKERLARGFYRGCVKLKAFVGWRAVAVRSREERDMNDRADGHFLRRAFGEMRRATEERREQRKKGFGRLCRAWDGWTMVMEEEKAVRRTEDRALGHWRLRIKAQAVGRLREFMEEKKRDRRKEEIATKLWRSRLLIKAVEIWEVKTRESKVAKGKIDLADRLYGRILSTRAFNVWATCVDEIVKDRKREKARGQQRKSDAFDALEGLRRGRKERREIGRAWGERREAKRIFEVLHGFVRALEGERDESFMRKIKLAKVVEKRIMGEAWSTWREVVVWGEKERIELLRKVFGAYRRNVEGRKKVRGNNAIAINFACGNLLEKTVRMWKWEAGKLAAARHEKAEKMVAEELEFRRERERIRAKGWEEDKERERFMREREEERKEETGRYKKEMEVNLDDLLPKFERKKLPEVRRPLEFLLSENVAENKSTEKAKEIPSWIVEEMNKKWKVDFTGLEERIGSVRGGLERSRDCGEEEVKVEEEVEVEPGVDLTNTTDGTEDTDRDVLDDNDDIVIVDPEAVIEPVGSPALSPTSSPVSPLRPESSSENVETEEMVRNKIIEMETALRMILADKQKMRLEGGDAYVQWKDNVNRKVQAIQLMVADLHKNL